MRIVEPGTIRGFANETTMSNHLMQMAVAEPEIMPQLATLFKSDYTAFSSLLANKGLTSQGLYAGLTSDSYKVVGNRKVMWPVKGINKRKGMIQSFSAPTVATPGIGGEIVTIYSDINWFSPYDVLELADNRTLVTVVDEDLAQLQTDGTYRYYVRLNRKSDASYINPALLAQGREFGFAMTNFYEMSETGYEKYTFDNWSYSHMTIQRMKWSISGTASQMDTRKIWIEHNGEYGWMEQAEYQMLQRWAEAREYQLLFGQGTVDQNDTIYLKDMKGREIMTGDGLLNLGDGALRFPYHKMTELFIENIFSNVQIMSDSDGVQEMVAIGGRAFMSDFNKLMRKIAGELNNGLVQGEGASKGINATYSFYEFNNVRVIPLHHKWFDDPSRPHLTTREGRWAESGRAIFMSLGRTDVGTNNVELLTLGNRSFLQGTVAGINKGGKEMANSVDGQHTHILSETGVKCANMFGIAEVFTPVQL